jgi:hypothetical protein
MDLAGESLFLLNRKRTLHGLRGRSFGGRGDRRSHTQTGPQGGPLKGGGLRWRSESKRIAPHIAMRARTVALTRSRCRDVVVCDVLDRMRADSGLIRSTLMHTALHRMADSDHDSHRECAGERKP